MTTKFSINILIEYKIHNAVRNVIYLKNILHTCTRTHTHKTGEQIPKCTHSCAVFCWLNYINGPFVTRGTLRKDIHREKIQISHLEKSSLYGLTKYNFFAHLLISIPNRRLLKAGTFIFFRFMCLYFQVKLLCCYVKINLKTTTEFIAWLRELNDKIPCEKLQTY